MLRDAYGFDGFGWAILLGDNERPLAISMDCRFAPRFDTGVAAGAADDLGTSRILSERPVVGSLVDGWAGSCDT